MNKLKLIGKFLQTVKDSYAEVLLAKTRIETTDKPIAFATKEATDYKIVIGNFPEDTLPGVLYHELLHVAFAHCEGTRKVNHRIMNYAMDIVINEIVRNDNMKLPDGVLYWQSFFKEIPSPFTSDHIYDLLMQNPEIQKENFCQTKGEELGDMVKDDEETQSEIFDAVEGSKIEKYVGGKVKEHIRRKKAFREFQANKKILALFIQKVLVDKRISSPKVSSRRDESDDIPGHTKLKKNNVRVVIDTSASIDDLTIEKMNACLSLIKGKYSVEVFIGDTDLREKHKINNSFNMDRIEYKGGGGTDLNFGFEDDKNVNLFIFFTDGYIPKLKNTKKSVCVLVGENVQKVDGVRNIRI